MSNAVSPEKTRGNHRRTPSENSFSSAADKSVQIEQTTFSGASSSGTTENVTGSTGVAMEAFNIEQQDHPVFKEGYEEITLKSLESKNAIGMKLNFKYIDLLLVRIISPNRRNGTPIVASTYKRNKVSNVESQVSYDRLYLFKVHSNNHVKQNQKLVYIFLSKTINEGLWGKCLQYRDNGKLTVGNFIRVPSPMPIKNYMNGDIPMLFTYNPVYLLKAPKVMISIPIDQQIKGNKSGGFVHSNVTVNSLHQFVKQTTCSGCHCDRQRISEWMHVKGCGCFVHGSTKTSMIIGHYIQVDVTAKEQLTTESFTSLKFNALFLSGEVPFSSSINRLQDTNTFSDMVGAMEKCLNHINTNEGFTVYGWYKRGEISDKTMVEAVNLGTMVGNEKRVELNNNKTDSSEISYHIVHIKPSHQDYYDPATQMYKDLKKLKYDITSIDDDDDDN